MTKGLMINEVYSEMYSKWTTANHDVTIFEVDRLD